MNLVSLLFSFRGRINRAKYWLTWLIYSGILIVFFAYFLIGAGVVSVARSVGPAVKYFTVGILIIIAIAAAWSSVVTGVKRLHDRDKSGWRMLLWIGAGGIVDLVHYMTPAFSNEFIFNIINLALTFWAFVELGCLRGTSGANRYGPDPLGGFSNEPLR